MTDRWERLKEMVEEEKRIAEEMWVYKKNQGKEMYMNWWRGRLSLTRELLMRMRELEDPT